VSDVRTNWRLIVETLAHIERAQKLGSPRIILRDHSAPLSRQEAVVVAMQDRAEGVTRRYQSTHHIPLNWGTRVDRGQVVGLTFIELELPLPERGTLHTARLRLVTGTTHPGWTMEGSGRLDLWKAGWNVLVALQRLLLQEESRKPRLTIERTFIALPDEHVAFAIEALVREADRLHHLIERIRTDD